MSNPRAVYTPRNCAKPETELSALAKVYAFILQRHQEKQKGGPATAPQDAERRSNAIGATRIIPKQP